MNLLLSPHNDDETLFAAFTIIRMRPHVIVCFGSAGDYGDSAERSRESAAAVQILGATGFEQWTCPPGNDLFLINRLQVFDALCSVERVYAPDPQSSHPDHVALGRAAATVFLGRVTSYFTYDTKSEAAELSQVMHVPEWTLLKLRALACYRTQILHPRANQFFMVGLHEWYGRDA